MNNKSFLDLANSRRSVREFVDRPVTDGEIEMLLEAARSAPSSNNKQPWRFVVVRDSDTIDRLVSAVPGRFTKINRWMKGAPCVIVCCGVPGRLTHTATKIALSNDLLTIDVTIAADHLVHAATEVGLGSCWVGWFTEKAVKKELKLPRRWRVIAMIALGRPKEPLETREPKRKGISEIAFRETGYENW